MNVLVNDALPPGTILVSRDIFDALKDPDGYQKKLEAEHNAVLDKVAFISQLFKHPQNSGRTMTDRPFSLDDL